MNNLLQFVFDWKTTANVGMCYNIFFIVILNRK